MRTRQSTMLAMAVVFASTLALGANQANAQGHGTAPSTQCSGPLCIGDTTSCTLEITHNDGFHDDWEIQSVSATVPAGNGAQPGAVTIQSISGNAFCAAGPSLPCTVCDGGFECGGMGVIDASDGTVVFLQGTYVVTAGDTSPLFTLFSYSQEDQCDGNPD